MDSLFPLQPLGVGSAEIESFNSYYMRLALAHSLTVGQLSRMLVPWRACTAEAVRLDLRHDGHGVSLCGLTDQTRAHVRLVATLTGVDHLDRTTFLSLRKVVTPSQRHSLRTSRAWCSACIAEARAAREPPYDRLAWTVQALRRCPYHKILLSTCCPTCAASQPFFSRATPLHICHECRNDLMQPPAMWTYVAEPGYAERDTYELVQAIANGQLLFKGGNPLRRFARELHRHFPSSKMNPASARIAVGIADRGLSTMFTLFKAAHVAQVPLVTILSEPEAAAGAAANLGFRGYAEPSYPHPRQHAAVVRRVRLELRQALARPPEEEIEPFIAFARRLGVTVGFIRGREPALCRDYANRRSQFRLTRRAANAERVRLALQGGLLDDLICRRIRRQRHLVDIVRQRCNVGKALAAKEVSAALDSRLGRHRHPRSGTGRPWKNRRAAARASCGRG